MQSFDGHAGPDLPTTRVSAASLGLQERTPSSVGTTAPSPYGGNFHAQPDAILYLGADDSSSDDAPWGREDSDSVTDLSFNSSNTVRIHPQLRRFSRLLHPREAKPEAAPHDSATPRTSQNQRRAHPQNDSRHLSYAPNPDPFAPSSSSSLRRSSPTTKANPPTKSFQQSAPAAISSASRQVAIMERPTTGGRQLCALNTILPEQHKPGNKSGTVMSSSGSTYSRPQSAAASRQSNARQSVPRQSTNSHTDDHWGLNHWEEKPVTPHVVHLPVRAPKDLKLSWYSKVEKFDASHRMSAARAKKSTHLPISKNLGFWGRQGRLLTRVAARLRDPHARVAPWSSNPGSSQPSASQPSASHPSASQPSASQHSVSQHSAGRPSMRASQHLSAGPAAPEGSAVHGGLVGGLPGAAASMPSAASAHSAWAGVRESNVWSPQHSAASVDSDGQSYSLVDLLGPFNPEVLHRIEAQLSAVPPANDAVAAFFPTSRQRLRDGVMVRQCSAGGPVIDCHSTPDLSTLVFITCALLVRPFLDRISNADSIPWR